MKSQLDLFRYFFAKFPVRGSFMVLSMMSASLAEGLGIASLLPLMNLVTAPSGDDAVFGRYLDQAFAVAGLQPTLGVILAMIVALITLKSLLLFVAMAQMGYTAAHVVMDMRLSLVHAFMEARWQHLIHQRAGDLASAIGGEPARAANGYLAWCRLLAGGIQVIIYVAFSFLISWQVTLAALAVGGVTMFLLRKFVVVSARAGSDLTNLQKSFMSRLLDGLNGIKPLKAMASERRLIPLIESDVRNLKQVQQALILSREGLTHFQEPVRTFALAIGIYFFLSIWGESLGGLVVLAIFFSRTVQRIGGLQSYYQTLVRNIPAYEFLRSTTQQAEEAREPITTGVVPQLTNAVALKNVTFSYGEDEVLCDVSLAIPKGRFVAVVGSSGAGKTTIADLVIGLLRPQDGDVWIDELPMRDIDIRAWRAMIGYVPQETFLFHDTITTNVTLGDPAISPDQVEDALRRAEAWDFVAALPEGVDTVVGERGSRLSGGQRQRIAIARALIRDPALLILDEATTALDPATEADIIATVQRLAGKITVLAISHQPAMKGAADFVYRVQDGSICAEEPATAAAAGI